MADNFADFYTGNMAPPLRLPGGGYAPAPSLQTQMTPEQIYEGIYGEPMQLTSRSVQTVAAPMQAATNAQFGVGAGMRGAGEATYQSPKVRLPNPVPGPDPVAKSQDRLPALPAGLPLAGPSYASAAGKLGAGGFGSGSLTAKASDKGVITLASEPVSDISGQNTANSFGRPVKTPSGKTYYPSNEPMSGVRAPYDQGAAAKYAQGSLSAKDTRGPLSRLMGLKTSGLGGLLAGLFGGGQQQQVQGLGALLGGGGSAISPGLGYNAAYSQTATGDGQGNNAFSSSDGYWGGARSLTD